MVRRRRDKAAGQLTDAEFELMSILWTQGEGTVRDVLARLPAGRDLAYTSVSTILRILEQKGAVTARKDGQTHIYAPAVSRDAYEATALRRFVSTVFDNAPAALVAKLLDVETMSKNDLAELRKLLDERLKP